jgi:hypothetical protein
MLPSRRQYKTAIMLPAVAVLCFSLASCSTVKPYQRAYLNDANMQQGKLSIEKFDENMQTYREGASGGGSGKASGGCGCN